MTRYLLIALLFALFVAGCGQKGPLYVPKPGSELPPPVEEQVDDQERQR